MQRMRSVLREQRTVGDDEMRLIDADAEIKKIEEEIQHAEKIIGQWRSRGIPGNSLYDIDKKIRKLERNITDCKIEIRILKSYTTAYDLDKVIEELKDCTVEFELFGTCSDYVEVDHAIEIIKRGGGTDKDGK